MSELDVSSTPITRDAGSEGRQPRLRKRHEVTFMGSGLPRGTCKATGREPQNEELEDTENHHETELTGIFPRGSHNPGV